MLVLHDVYVRYGAIAALRGVSLHVEQGEIVGLIGVNGAGKSTTLMTIAGVLQPRSGTIAFRGESIVGSPPEEIVRKGIALIPEGRRIFPCLTVEENLRLGASIRSDRSGVQRDLDEMCERFPVLADRLHQAAGTLSGGEQQQLAIARGLMSRPTLLMLDEPSLGLAPLLVQEIFDIVKRINAEQGTSVLLVEQNARAALSISHYGYVLENGRVVLDGPGEKLIDNEDIKEFYLGLSSVGKRGSYREVKHYKRRKRWL